MQPLFLSALARGLRKRPPASVPVPVKNGPRGYQNHVSTGLYKAFFQLVKATSIFLSFPPRTGELESGRVGPCPWKTGRGAPPGRPMEPPGYQNHVFTGIYTAFFQVVQAKSLLPSFPPRSGELESGRFGPCP